jgi:hypothetical protein
MESISGMSQYSNSTFLQDKKEHYSIIFPFNAESSFIINDYLEKSEIDKTILSVYNDDSKQIRHYAEENIIRTIVEITNNLTANIQSCYLTSMSVEIQPQELITPF